jgi:hypothetical protein
MASKRTPETAGGMWELREQIARLTAIIERQQEQIEQQQANIVELSGRSSANARREPSAAGPATRRGGPPAGGRS